MPKYVFTDLVNIKELQMLMESLYDTFQVPSAILDLEENVLVAAGWTDICTKYHRRNPATALLCKESDAYIKSHLTEQGYAAYKCKNGLNDIAFPVMIENEHLATFFFGQFLYDDDPVDFDKFRAQANEAGFNVDEYLEALSRVPRISRDNIKSIIDYHKKMASILIDIGQNNLKLKREIEERLRVEAALKENEEYLRSIFTAADSVAFIITDFEGEETSILDFSAGAEKIFGYSREEVLGKKVALLHSPEDVLLFPRMQEPLKGPKAKYSGEHTLVRKSGEKFPALITIHPRQNASGEIIGTIGVSIDITDQKKLEEQLSHAQKMESIGRLSGGIAHDFNNILTAIIGNAELLLSSLSPEDRQFNEITEILNSANRAAQLTRQLLAFSRRQIIKPQTVNLNSLLFKMDKMLRRLIGEDLEFVTLTDDNLWPVVIDPGQIEQVLTNLVVNARDAMPNGGKLVIETANVVMDESNTETHGEIPQGEYVMTTVTDTGVGIDKETIQHIFDPFYTTKETGKGTGLGLSTCYGIIKQNHGSIWVHSEHGHGTSIKFYLPRSEQQETKPFEHKKLSQAHGGDETILLVEDEPAVRNLTSRILRNRGYRVIEASNGEEAVRIVTQSDTPHIHLLVTDVVMPHMGGIELQRIIQKMFPDMKVLFMSGYTDQTITHHNELESGPAFIQKPFSTSQITKLVRSLLDS